MTGAKVLAGFVAWRCGCSQTAPTLDAFPTRCPGHDAEQIARPEWLQVLAEYAQVHLCSENPHQQPCPGQEKAA